MTTTIVVIVLVVVLIGVGLLYARKSSRTRAQHLANTEAEARRWVERLGGQVMNLTGTDTASKQALADASERYTAAGSQMDQAETEQQYQLAQQTAFEGLYYVRAARTAMGMDPGPELPEPSNHSGKVTEDKKVTVEGAEYRASPNPGAGTPHYYPGGTVQGRPVPQGWYSTPWWKTALTGAAAGVGGFMIADALFGGMGGFGMGGFGGMGMGMGGFDGMGYDGDMGMGDMGGMDDVGGGFGDFGDFGDFGGFDDF